MLSKNILFTVNKNIKEIENGVLFETIGDKFYFSFWETNELSIYFEASLLNFSAKTDYDKKNIQISSFIQKIEKRFKKENLKSNSIFDIIDTIIETEKEIIDAQILKAKFISKVDIGIDFITQKHFDENIYFLDSIKNKLKNKQSNTIDTTSEENLLLTKLELSNIVRFSELNLEFGKRATIILGENGTGKTSILRAILLGLIDNNLITNKKSELIYLLKTEKPSAEKYFKTFGRIIVSTNLYIKKQVLIRYDYTEKNLELRVNGFGLTNPLVYNEIYFKQLILAFPQIQTHATIGNISEVQLPMIYENKPNVDDIKSLLYNRPLDCLRELANWIFKLDADARGTSNDDKNKKIVLEKLFSTLSGVIGTPIRLHKTEHTRDQIWVEVGEDAKKEISLFQVLSQGFKNVFAWVGHIMRRMAESKDYAPDFNEQAAIILIDEIDTYLHPKWQRTILKTLLDNFPNTQFIISTHSPLVANYIPPTTVSSEDLRVYVLEVDSPEPRRLDKVYGQDIKTIFAELGVAERPIEVSKKIEALFIDLETVKTVEELSEINTRISQLKEILDPQDSIFVSLEYAFGDAEWRLDNPAENDIFE